MVQLFGLDVAGLLADAISSAGDVAPGTLVKSSNGTRVPGSLTAGTNPSTTIHSFRGILEMGQRRIPGTLDVVTGTFVTVLGASVSPAAAPAVNDLLTIEGKTFTAKELVERDPAGATYVFRVEG